MKLEENKSLKKLSTFQIGGRAKYYIEVESIQNLKSALIFANEKQCKIFVLGKGSNALFDDKGFNGLVIHNKMSFCEYNENQVFVGAGFNFSKLAFESSKKGLSGFEFAAGIPASVGGAIYMNASANNQKVSDCLDSVSYMSYDGRESTIDSSDIAFSYRQSSFQEMRVIITSANFTLKKAVDAKERLSFFLLIKKNTQPLNSKNAGCIFRNPENNSAGRLIEKCGLKGYRCNGAVISEKHANFIINENDANSEDVLFLIELIKKEIKKQQNVSLQTEICYVPY